MAFRMTEDLSGLVVINQDNIEIIDLVLDLHFHSLCWKHKPHLQEGVRRA